MKNIGIYIRVSTQEQKEHGFSVDAQLKALKDYANENKYNIVGIYNDAGISAHISYKKRPELLRMIQDCQKGKIDLVCFTKLDRFFRNVPDYYSCIEMMNNTPWRAIWEDYETETSAGKFKVNIMLSIAQAESDRTSERIKSTFEYKKAKGEYVGTAPWGYKKENGHLVKDEKTRELVEYAYDIYFKNHSSVSIRKALLENKGVSISRTLCFHLLNSETYRGNAYGYKCEPYLTQEQARLIDEIKSRNYRSPKGYNFVYLFPRLCRCASCGSIMRSQAKKDGYKNYSCNYTLTDKHYGKNNNSISEKKLEKYLIDELDNILKDYNIKADQINQADIIKESEQKKAALESKLKRVGIRFEEGEISVEEYKEKRKAIQNEIASLDFPTTSPKVELPNNWKEIYSSLDTEHKKQFWLSIIKEIKIDNHFVTDIIFN